MTSVLPKTIRDGKRYVEAKQPGETWEAVALRLGQKANTVRGRASDYNRFMKCQSVSTLKLPARDNVIPLGAAQHHFDRVLFKAAVFDIETTDFGTDGYEGHPFCCSVLPLDSDKVHTIKLGFHDPDDKRALWETINYLSQYDILIGHNIVKFDMAWLGSRVIFHQWPLFRRWFLIDTYNWSRRVKLRTSKRLGNLISYFRVPNAEKTAVQRTDWSRVRSRFEDEFNMGMTDIVYHCENDVIANREVFFGLYPYVMSSRYSSSSPIQICDQGAGLYVPFYTGKYEEAEARAA